MTATKTRLGSGDFARRIRFEQSGNISATDVQEAIEELDSEKQASDVGLTDIAGLAVTDGNFIVGDGANWVAESGGTARTSLGLAIGTDVQAWDDDLDDLAALTHTKGNVIVSDGTDWIALGVGTNNFVLTADSVEASGVKWAAGGGANSFETIDCPNGTDPVADSSTDTLVLADGDAITITGDSGTDTVTIAVDLATPAEAEAKTETAKAVTPEGLANFALLSQVHWTIVEFTASDPSWSVPAGTTEMMIEGWGGGGSGAGGDTGGQRGSGGAGGGHFMKLYNGTMDSTLNITVGAGGAVVAATGGGAAGNAGVNTSVVGTNLGTLTANGGGGGQAGVASGGQGGNATGGDMSLRGEDGRTSNATLATNGVFIGGASPRGGKGGVRNVGIAGLVPGGGGACGNHSSGNSGAGGDGRVFIWHR